MMHEERLDLDGQARELCGRDGRYEVDVVAGVGLKMLSMRGAEPVGQAFLTVDVTAFRQPGISHEHKFSKDERIRGTYIHGCHIFSWQISHETLSSRASMSTPSCAMMRIKREI